MNLWQRITGNSTLPVQAGTNFWSHLNNQQPTGGGDVFLMGDVALTLAVEQDMMQIEITEAPMTLDLSAEEIELHITQGDNIELGISTDNVEIEL